MKWDRQPSICSLIFLLLAESAVHLGSCASPVNSGNDTFTIQHSGTGKCLLVQNGVLKLGNCSSVPAVSWKWGSGHRLFHMESFMCLGLEVRSKTLSLSSCSSTEFLRWRCFEDIIYTEYQMKLSVLTDGTVIAKKDAQDAWKQGGTSENICQQPYRRMHTSGGNSNGAPCEFPFLYNGTWHLSCVPGTGDKPLDWCSTTANYDMDLKWGNCLKYVNGCSALWEKASGKGRCYQVVSTAVVTWHEARDACRSQGGDLLSVSSPEDLEFFSSVKSRGDMPSKLWIGLNHLDWMQGWQWSDGSALSFIPWEKGIPIRSLLSDEDCGVLKESLQFGAETCENRLPFICEKTDGQAESSAVSEVYNHTVCKNDWVGWKGFCYQLHKGQESKLSQAEAVNMCKISGAQLASMHSIEDVEMLHVNFHQDLKAEVWIGLMGDDTSPVFKWMDGTAVTFTYWARAQPPLLLPNTTNCVYYSGEHHTWSVSECGKQRSYMCKMLGTVNDSLPGDGCPSDGTWKRHSNACYKVDTEPVYYKNSCHITINNRFEQIFINSLLKEHIGSETLYFWTGLQDSKGSGEYQWISQDRVTYANWRLLEPAFPGGCVVMSAGSPLGQWAVKNCTLFRAGNICKRPITSIVQPTPEPTLPVPDLNASCAAGWVSREGLPYCYKVFHGERLTRKRSWEEAERFCESLGAHLPSFTEVKEMQGLHSILRDSVSDNRFFWVGLNRRNPNNNNNWEWSDGRPVSMTIFPQELQEDDEYNRDCIAFKTFKETYKTFLFLLLRNFPTRPFYPSTFHCDAKLEWVCQIPRGQTPETPEWYNPDGLHNTSSFIEGQEFWFVTKPELSFDEAVLYCSSNNSKLAAPNTFNAARHLQEQLSTHGDKRMKWWADLRYPGPHVPFALSPMHYYHSAFLGRCPSITPIFFEPGFSGNCNEKKPFVCEAINITSVEKETPGQHSPGTKCEDTDYQFRDKCYRILSRSKYHSFKEANEFCETLKGSLITISDQAEQDFITTLLPQFPGQPKKVWIGLKFRPDDTQWVDNSPISYLNFNPLLHGQFRPFFFNTLEQDSLELCAYMYNDAHSDLMGTWDYTSCSDPMFSTVCQHYADKSEDPVVHQDKFAVGNYTYKIVQEKNLTWTEAQDLCRRQNMTLASVPNAYVQAVLTVNVTRGGQPLWIGLFSDDDGEHYHWTDRSHIKFNRWSPEPTAGACVYLDIDGFWKATECIEELSGAICHVPQSESITPDVDTTTCPHKNNGQNWIRFKQNCYTLLLGSSRWSSSDISDQQICKSLAGNGEFLTIRDEEENNFIRQQLQPFKNLASFMWLGMNRSKTDEQLKWLDGSNVQYSRWKDDGRPAITGPFMVGLKLNGEWEVITNQRLFTTFKQQSIVVCKIENGPKDEYMKDVVDIEAPEGISYRRVAKKMNWYQALQECGKNGGHLASITDKIDNENMARIAKRDGFSLWIGLSSQDLTGWPFEWSDGKLVKYQPDGFVNDGFGTEEKCVFVDSKGTWTAVGCHSTQEGAICYNNIKEETSAHVSSQSNSCPKNNNQSSWVAFKDHCYAFNTHNYSVMSMEKAKNVCQSLDLSSKLLTISSQEENDFVCKYLNENPSITSRVWLGLNLDNKGEPTSWEDGSELDFSKWVTKSRPQLSQTASKICAVMVSSNGTWTQASCSNSRSRIVCKAPAQSGNRAVSVFFIIIFICIVAVVSFVIYRKYRHRFSSTVRYQRNFGDGDSTSMIADTE